MRTGRIVEITKDGPIFHPDALHSFGVAHKSVFYGVFLPPHYTQEAEIPKQEYHLILSPILPASWPYIFRLELLISNTQGSLAWVADFLAKKHVNILFAECTEAGHYHAIWNLVAEVSEFRQEHEDEDRQVLETANEEDKKTLAFKRMCQLWQFLPELIDDLEKADTKKKFIYGRFRDRICTFNETFFSEPAVKKLLEENDLKRFKSRPADFAFFPDLTHIWRHAKKVFDPLRMHYDQEIGALTPDEGRNKFASILGTWKHDLPCMGISSIVDHEKYVRLQLVSGRDIRDFFETTFEYEVKLDEYDPNYNATIGLIRDVTSKMADENFNLLHVHNSIEKSEPGGLETGTLKMVFDTKHNSKVSREEHAQERLDAVAKSLATKSGWQSGCFRVSRLPRLNIFVSWHVEGSKELARQIDEIGKELCCRFNHEFTHTKAAAVEVARRLRASDAVLQIWTGRRTDHPWLEAEAFGAILLGKPNFQIVDIRSPHIEQNVSKDISPEHVDVTNPVEFREAVVNAVREFREELLPYPGQY